jgi:hypothetical protein
LLRFDRFLDAASRRLTSPMVCIVVFLAAVALSTIDFRFALLLVAAWLAAAALLGIVLKAFVSTYVARVARRKRG